MGMHLPIAQLVGKLTDWHAAEVAKEQAKRNPSETRIGSLDDRLDCLLVFCNAVDVHTSGAVVAKINSVFTDDKTIQGVRLSSIHRSKGLESDRVFLLQPPGPQRPVSKMQPWEREQEDNILYVGTTRAIRELIYVS
jgi:superfamily I DNA/RNA helicase